MNRTRIVRWLQVVLPMLALVLLSTMFLFSRGSDVESRIPYAEVDAQAAARDSRILAPEYSGVTDDGAQVTLRADRAMPTPGGGQAGALQLDWLRPDGLSARVTAPAGGAGDGVLRLEGGVRMTTSSGWRLDAPDLEAETARSEIRALNGVDATAPFGRITAGRMTLAPSAPDSDPAILNFSDGVRLIYQP